MLVRARSPLRLGLAGGGTDLSPYCDQHGGAVLNVTIDLYAYATLEIGGSRNVVEFATADTNEECTLDLSGDAWLEPGTLQLHRAVYRRIVRDYLGGRPIGCRLTTYCEAPPGSGLGSSSTLVVTMVKSFSEALGLPLGEYDIAHLAYEVERLDVGLMGGRQDQYAATFGGFNFIEFYADDRVIVNPLRIKDWIVSELEASIVLFHTGVSRESANIIAEQTRNISEIGSVSIHAMHELKADAFSMKEALLRGEILRMGEILNSSWASKRRTAHAVSNTRIDNAMSAAFASGARAAKVSGAGGGGFMLFLVDPIRRLELIRSLERMPGHVVSCSFARHGTESWRID